MKREDFVKEIESFAELYCGDYMREHNVTFCFDDIDDPTAEIKCEDFSGHKWIVPICLSNRNPEEVRIDVGDAGTLRLDGGGFYCYLWHEAVSRIVID